MLQGGNVWQPRETLTSKSASQLRGTLASESAPPPKKAQQTQQSPAGEVCSPAWMLMLWNFLAGQKAKPSAFSLDNKELYLDNSLSKLFCFYFFSTVYRFSGDWAQRSSSWEITPSSHSNVAGIMCRHIYRKPAEPMQAFWRATAHR